MEVHTFRAASLQEALEQVRLSLGPDASVLQTREIKRSRLGLFAKTSVEVEASSMLPAPMAASPRESTLPSTAQAPGRSTPVADSLLVSAPPTDRTSNRLADKEATVQEQAVRGTNPNTPRLPAALFETLSELLDAGVDPAAAKQLVQAAAQHCTPEQLEDSWLVKGRVVQLVSADLRVAEPFEVHHGRQQVVAVVGPTGVGKTTTLAKLGTRFQIDQGCRVGFVTMDTFRPGAVDQLLQYAESLNAPLEVVSSADQFLPALQRLKACDLVLVDSAGRSPTDTEQISILSRSLLAARPTAVHLVVSATSSAGHIRAAMKQFAPLNPTGLVITKLDEAVGFGEWLSLLRHSELPVGYLTHGQNVTHDLAVANRRRLASLLLGHANHHSTTLAS